MRPDEYVGRTGRSSTEIAASGRVELDGRQFDALTLGPPIPAGETVEVTGWRLIDELRPVLSVSAVHRSASGPAPPPPPLRPIGVPSPEPAGEEPWQPGWSDWDWGQLLLTVCQVMSALSCGAAVLYGLFALLLSPLLAVGSAIGALYSAGMFVMFGRVKQLPRK